MHLVDHVFPLLPVRQWVLSLPKRLRYFLRHDRRAVTAVLTIFLQVIEQRLRACSPGAAPKARLGAVSFLHRFGSALNEHIHFHCCVIDGVFEPGQEDGEPTLMRKWPCPVWINKPIEHKRYTRIMVAVDPATWDPTKAGLNTVIMELATSLAITSIITNKL